MTTKTDVLNTTLGLLGQPPSSGPTDTSTWVKRCVARYNQSARSLLEQHPWNFPAACVQLERLAEEPVSAYAYAHNKPSDFLRINRVAPNNDPDDKTYYRYGDEGGKILTSFEETFLWFISNKWITKEGSWPQVFADAVSADIASFVSPTVVRSTGKRESSVVFATRMLKKAKSFDASQKPFEENPPGKWSRARRVGARYNTEGH